MQITATDSASLDAIISSLGTGDALKNKLDQNLRDQGLEASSGVSVIDSSSTVTATSSSSGLRISGVTSGSFTLISLACFVALVPVQI